MEVIVCIFWYLRIKFLETELQGQEWICITNVPLERPDQFLLLLALWKKNDHFTMASPTLCLRRLSFLFSFFVSRVRIINEVCIFFRSLLQLCIPFVHVFCQFTCQSLTFLLVTSPKHQNSKILPYLGVNIFLGCLHFGFIMTLYDRQSCNILHKLTNIFLFF